MLPLIHSLPPILCAGFATAKASCAAWLEGK